MIRDHAWLIRDHAWRPSHSSGNQTAAARLRCAWLGRCGRTRDEHERAVEATGMRPTKVRQP